MEDMAVVLEEFTNQQEGVDSGDAVGDDAGYPFALAGFLALDEELAPE